MVFTHAFLMNFLLFMLVLISVTSFDRFVLSFYRQKWKKERDNANRRLAFIAINEICNILRPHYLRNLFKEIGKPGHADLPKLLPYKGDPISYSTTSSRGCMTTYRGYINGSNNKFNKLWNFPNDKDCPSLLAFIETYDEVYDRELRREVSKRVIYIRCKCMDCGKESNVDGMEYANGARHKSNKKYPKHPRVCHTCLEKEKVKKDEERAAALKAELEDTGGLVIHHANTCFVCLDNEATLCLSTCTHNHMSANGPVPVMCKGCARKLVGKKGHYREEAFRNCPLCRTPFRNIIRNNFLQKAFVGTPVQMDNRY